MQGSSFPTVMIVSNITIFEYQINRFKKNLLANKLASKVKPSRKNLKSSVVNMYGVCSKLKM